MKASLDGRPGAWATLVAGAALLGACNAIFGITGGQPGGGGAGGTTTTTTGATTGADGGTCGPVAEQSGAYLDSRVVGSKGDNGYTVGYGVAAGSDGSVSVTGWLGASDVYFDPGDAPLPYVASYDVFVARYDAGRNLLWAHAFGSAGDDVGNGVAVDAAGNTYVVGYLGGAVAFDATHSCTPAGIDGGTAQPDLFVLKLDPSGQVIWVQCAGDDGSQEARRVTIDAEGNPVIAALVEGTFTLGKKTVNGSNGSTLFARLDAATGDALWVQTVPCVADNEAESASRGPHGVGVAAEPGGDVYVTGTYSCSYQFDATDLLVPAGADVFVARLDGKGDGHVIWAKTFGDQTGGSDDQWPNDVAVDPCSGDVYLTGGFLNTICFGPASPTTACAPGSPLVHTLAANDPMNPDLFIAKLGSDGTLAWASTYGAAGVQTGVSLHALRGGGVIMAGYLLGSSPIDFGLSQPITGHPTGTYIYDDGLLVDFDPTGKVRWARELGDADRQDTTGVTVDPAGDVVVVGTMAGTVYLDQTHSVVWPDYNVGLLLGWLHP